MRVLIVGAGIAGLTLSALLRQKGITPQIVDRASDFAQAGYMLGLFPMGNRVLHGLGAFDAFVRRSEPMDTYALCNGHGETMQTFDIASALGKFGATRQLPRADLLEILRDCAPDVPLRMGTRATTLVEQGDEVEAFAGRASAVSTWSSVPTASTPRRAATSRARSRCDRPAGAPGCGGRRPKPRRTSW